MRSGQSGERAGVGGAVKQGCIKRREGLRLGWGQSGAGPVQGVDLGGAGAERRRRAGAGPGQAGISAVLGPGALPAPAGPSLTGPDAGCAGQDAPRSAIAGPDCRVQRSRLRPAPGAALWARRPRGIRAGSAPCCRGAASRRLRGLG